MESVWNDIGYNSAKGLKKEFLKTAPEVVKSRFLALGAEVLKEAGQHLVVKLLNRRIELWCASDTYFLESKQSYGHDIQILLRKIEQRLSRTPLNS